jgi:hypothetical protein
MAIPLFHFKADPRDVSGVELNLGNLGSVLSTATNLDSLNMTASALNFSNSSQQLTLSKEGITTISNDLKKTVSLYGNNTSAGVFFKDFTLDASFPAKSELTPLGLTIAAQGLGGNTVNMTSSAITVGGTSVTWANVIASGAELQNIEAFVTPPNASTIALVNTLQVKDTPTGNNSVTTLATSIEQSISLIKNGTATAYFNQDLLHIQTNDGIVEYNSSGIDFGGGGGDVGRKVRLTMSEFSNARATNYTFSSAGSLSLTATTTLNVTTPVITVTGPTLLNSLVTPMVVTTEYLPVTIGGSQYYLLLSKVA